MRQATSRATGGPDSARQREIQDFVRRFLTSFDAGFREVSSGVYEVDLPRELAESLGTPQRLRFRLLSPGKRDNGQVDSAEIITDGHPVLDRMTELAAQRGLAASLLFTSSMEPGFVEAVQTWDPFHKSARREPSGDPPPAFSSLVKVVGGIAFPNTRPRVTERRIVHQAQVLFYFKVSFVSDERREFMVPLLMDPNTESVDRMVNVYQAASAPSFLQVDRRTHAYTVSRLYEKAREHLAGRIRREATAFRRDADERLNRELERIEEYYAGLMQETVEPLRQVFRRMAAARVRLELARSWQTGDRFRSQFEKLKEEAKKLEAQHDREIEGLKREKEQRIAEVREKYQARAEVTLTHAALVMVPRVEWRLSLKGRGRRETLLTYDLLRRRLVDWKCESCEGTLGRAAYLCGCEAIVCRRCYRRCEVCGDETCPDCGMGRCHVCKGLLCRNCDPTCPSADRHPETEMPKVCAACKSRICDECMALTHLFSEAGP